MLLPVETIGFIILIIGLAVEFLGSHKAMRIADRQNSMLAKAAADAKKLAGESIERASITESNNLLLRKQVVALEEKLAHRHITQTQRESFVNALREAPKGQVVVLVRIGAPNEAKEYAVQIHGALKLAGYGVPSGVLEYAETPPFFTPLDTSIQLVTGKAPTEFTPMVESLVNAITNFDGHLAIFSSQYAPQLPGVTNQSLLLVLEKP